MLKYKDRILPPKSILYQVFLVVLIFSATACSKYLDVTPKGVVVPKTVTDLQALLDQSNVRYSGFDVTESAGDNFYATISSWQSVQAGQGASSAQNYIWEGNQTDGSWEFAHVVGIYRSNFVLDVLSIVDQSDRTVWNATKGHALLLRSIIFWQMAQVYSKPYSSSASTDLGIPMKLSSDIDEKYVRATLKNTYDRIIEDVKESIVLLPNTTPSPTRPVKGAAYGLLARIFLSMRDYSNAALYADSSLQFYSTLMDYNRLVPVSGRAIPLYPNNSELVWEFGNFPESILSQTVARVDTNFYKSFDENDLRKELFFGRNADGSYYFRGSYKSNSADNQTFSGIATDEMYLIRAECAARSGKKAEALVDLNLLMIKRWKSSNWQPFTAIDASDALSKILSERRKELCFRGLRWSDLRRFNLEGANISLKRILGSSIYTLHANDPRWVLLLPQNIVNFSGVQQNER